MTLFFHKEIVSVSLDRETARAQGIPVLFFDLLLYVAVSLAVVMSVQTIGNVLVLALLVTPAATARLLVDRLTHMMFLSALIAVMGSFWGDLPIVGDGSSHGSNDCLLAHVLLHLRLDCRPAARADRTPPQRTSTAQ